MRVVAAATAHQVAAARLLRCPVARPATCAHAAGRQVFLAIVGRLIYVDQVRDQRLAVRVWLLDLEKGPPLVIDDHGLHVHCYAILVLEEVAQLTELGQRGPAGSGRAGSRHSMTFALLLHVLL